MVHSTVWFGMISEKGRERARAARPFFSSFSRSDAYCYDFSPFIAALLCTGKVPST